MESSSLSGTPKRTKALGNASQIAHCLVDGCNADLSQCREYHRRHKVCELHSKTPKVTIGGREQRFCQQCSRFHSLAEFDEGKRSCRKRLDGHNRRRRKAQPELSRNAGMLFPSQQAGARILSFSPPQIFPSAVVSSNWTGVVKPENDGLVYNNQSNVNYMDRQNVFQEPSSHDYNKGTNQFQLMQSTNRSLPQTSVCRQPLLDPDPDSASGHNNSGQKIFFSDGLNQVINPSRALSLLSSAPAVTREIGFSHMDMVQQPDSISLAQSSAQNLHYGSPGQFHFAQEMENCNTLLRVSERDSQVSSNTTLQFQGTFQHGTVEESTTSGGSHQTLTFLWE